MSDPKSHEVKVARWSDLEDRKPAYALVSNVDLVVVRYDDQVSVLYGRCLHRGALMADGHIRGDDIICGVHGWDYRFDTGVSAYNPEEVLHKFPARIDPEGDAVYVDRRAVRAFEAKEPQAYDRDAYLGLYDDVHGTPEEPYNNYIRQLARDGLSKTGHHGPVSAMGVPLTELPRWESIQFVTAQLHRMPLLDDAPVGTDVVIGPGAKKPLRLPSPERRRGSAWPRLRRPARGYRCASGPGSGSPSPSRRRGP